MVDGQGYRNIRVNSRGLVDQLEGTGRGEEGTRSVKNVYEGRRQKKESKRNKCIGLNANTIASFLRIALY